MSKLMVLLLCVLLVPSANANLCSKWPAYRDSQLIKEYDFVIEKLASKPNIKALQISKELWVSLVSENKKTLDDLKVIGVADVLLTGAVVWAESVSGSMKIAGVYIPQKKTLVRFNDLKRALDVNEVITSTSFTEAFVKFLASEKIPYAGMLIAIYEANARLKDRTDVINSLNAHMRLINQKLNETNENIEESIKNEHHLSELMRFKNFMDGKCN